MTNFPILAEYGVKNNAHDLILKSDVKFQPSPLLLNYTDRPPGQLSRNEKIYPYLSFEVLENYGYLWITEEDDSSERKGMVKSKVLIYPIKDLIKEDNIQSVINRIISVEPTIPDTLLIQLFQDLINDSTNILFLKAPQESSYFFSKLWQHLSPLDRENLSYRFYLYPSQKSDDIDKGIIYSLHERINQWNENKIPDGIFKLASERVAKYLLTGKDTTFKKVLFSTAFIELPTKKRLQKIALLLNFFDDFKKYTSVDKAILIIRVCDPIVNKSEMAEIISPVMNFIKKNVEYFSMKQLQSLANITLDSFPEYTELKKEMEKFFIENFPLVNQDDQAQILNELDRQKDWWQNFFGNSVKQGISKNTDQWINIFIKALKQNDNYQKILQFAPDTINEDLVISKLENISKLSNSQSSSLETLSLSRHWSKLYAFALRNIYDIGNAIQKQMQNFKNSASQEFSIILKGFSIEQVINYVRDSSINSVRDSIINNNSLKHDFFTNIDFSHMKDVELMSLSNTIDSDINFIVQDQKKLKNTLCIMIEEQNSYDILPKIIEYDNNHFIPKIMLYELNLDSFASWNKGFKADFEVVTDLIAQFLIKNDQEKIPPIFFQNLVAHKYLNSVDKMLVLTRLISWNFRVNENLIYEILVNATDQELSNYGELIGKYLNEQNFKSLIDKLYEENKQKFDRIILPQCYLQLSFWKSFGYLYRVNLPINSIIKAPEARNDIVRKLAEELSELYPNFSDLQIVWKKVGGKSGQLSEKNNMENSWFAALSDADKGKIKYGIKDILDIALQDYPSNCKLKYIKKYFSNV